MKNIFDLCYIMLEFIFHLFIIPNIKYTFARYNSIILASLRNTSKIVNVLY